MGGRHLPARTHDLIRINASPGPPGDHSARQGSNVTSRHTGLRVEIAEGFPARAVPRARRITRRLRRKRRGSAREIAVLAEGEFLDPHQMRQARFPLASTGEMIEQGSDASLSRGGDFLRGVYPSGQSRLRLVIKPLGASPITLHSLQQEVGVITDRIDSVTKIPPEYMKAAPPAPKSVKIEISPRCNYRCGFCALRPYG